MKTANHTAKTAVDDYVPAPGERAPILPPGKLELKYLFGAMFEDGSTFFQTPEDVHPAIEGRNAYYELLSKDEAGSPHEVDSLGFLRTRSDIRLFQLAINDDHIYLVDLADGHFEVQHMKGRQKIGHPFFIAYPPKGAKLRVFYFRRRRHHSNAGGIVREDGTVDLTSDNTVGQECEYHFGWETEDRQHRAEMILT